MICPKKSGNTYTVCSYVSSHSDVELNVGAKAIQSDLLSYEVIILASGIYLNHVHLNILRWIKGIEQNTINLNTKVYLFSTWFGRGESDKATFNEVKKLLNEKDIKLEDNYMTCFGKGMGMIKTSHPNEEDNKNVLLWAKGL